MSWQWFKPRQNSEWASSGWATKEQAIDNAVYNAFIQGGGTGQKWSRVSKEECDLLWQSMARDGWDVRQVAE